MHAVQLLPHFCRLMIAWGVGLRVRLQGVGLLGLGFDLLTLFAAQQTFRGRSRLDIDDLSVNVLIGALVPFLFAGGLACRRRQTS